MCVSGELVGSSSLLLLGLWNIGVVGWWPKFQPASWWAVEKRATSGVLSAIMAHGVVWEGR